MIYREAPATCLLQTAGGKVADDLRHLAPASTAGPEKSDVIELSGRYT
jgi:hypothetical protein